MINRIRYFVEAIRLWANSKRPLIDDEPIKISVEMLDGSIRCFEAMEAPEAIDLDGCLLVRSSDNVYIEVAAIPMLWLDPEYVEANRHAEALRHAETFVVHSQEDIQRQRFFDDLSAMKRVLELPLIQEKASTINPRHGNHNKPN